MLPPDLVGNFSTNYWQSYGSLVETGRFSAEICYLDVHGRNSLTACYD